MAYNRRKRVKVIYYLKQVSTALERHIGGTMLFLELLVANVVGCLVINQVFHWSEYWFGYGTREERA